MKKLPVGVEFFTRVIENNYYYVDKTGLIRDLLNSGTTVTLFTRPRRFGKSLNMDMLKTFFQIDTDISLFDGLEISKEKELCGKYQGKFPVISISLKDIIGKTYDDALKGMSAVINRLMRKHQYLLYDNKLSEVDKSILKPFFEWDLPEHVQSESLVILSEMLYKYYGRKIIIIIDEYDVPLDKAYQKGYYDDMVSFIRLLFSKALKTNDYLELAVLTGCLRVSRESIFTGLNNFEVRTVSDNKFSEYFGFTNKEVGDMLEYYGLSDKYSLFKKWYNGYRFGSTEVYCPWDVINQCKSLYDDKNAAMKPYWINSSGNSIVKNIIKNGSGRTKSQLEALVHGDSIKQEIIQELTYPDLNDTSNEMVNLWSILYTTGYLTDACAPLGDIHTLIIPNLEVYKIYEKQILPLYKEKVVKSSTQWEQFCMAVAEGNALKMEELINWFLFSQVSIRDTYYRKDIKENFYHGFLLQTLSINDLWYVRSNIESGTGYPDILVEDEKAKKGWVFELKYAEDKEKSGEQDKKLVQACNEAIQQIKDNDYTAILKKDGMETIYISGVAFCRKKCKIICEQEK